MEKLVLNETAFLSNFDEAFPFKKNTTLKSKDKDLDEAGKKGFVGNYDAEDGAEAISESLGKVLVNVFSPKVGGWHSMLLDSVEEAKKWVRDLELDLSEDYFEIHTGDNITDVDGLVAWGGKGGFWANVVSGQFDDAPFNKNKSEREKARDEKIKQAALKKEVKNGKLNESEYMPDRFEVRKNNNNNTYYIVDIYTNNILAKDFDWKSEADSRAFEMNRDLAKDELDEGWKDNLKKAAGAAAVAGSLFASNPAYGNDINSYNSRPYDEFSIQDEDDYEDMVSKTYDDGSVDLITGEHFTAKEWNMLKKGQDPMTDGDEIVLPECGDGSMITEGTHNFMLFNGANLAFDDEELAANDVMDNLVSPEPLPDYVNNARNYNTFVVNSSLDTDFAVVCGRHGYYEGINIGVVPNNDWFNWAYENYYYEQGEGWYDAQGKTIAETNEDMEKLFNKLVAKEVAKGNQELKNIKEMFGGKFINMAAMASNGEAEYKEVNEAKEPMSLSDFKKKMKEKGYNVRSKSVSFQGLGYGNGLDVKVYDGSTLINGGDGMSPEHFSKYKDVFDILNNYKIVNEAQITGENSPSGIDFLKTLDEKGRYMFLSRMQQDCKYFLDGHEYNKFLWAGNVEDQIKYMKWLYNSFPKNKKPEWISMEEIEDYEKRMAGKGKEDHSRDEIDEQMLDEGVGSRGMIKAIEKAFDDGRYGRYGKWECGLGGYGTGYQVSYEHIPFFEIKEDDTVKFLSNNLMKRKTGYTPQDIIDILSEIGDYTISSESYDEELDESINTEIETGSIVLLKDGRKVEIIGRAYGSGGIQCGYKVFDEDTNTDSDPEEIMFDDIKRVIQEPINESAHYKLSSKKSIREADESSKNPFEQSAVKIDDIKISDAAWGELDLSGLKIEDDTENEQSMLQGNTAEDIKDVNLRADGAKSVDAEMKVSDNDISKDKEPKDESPITDGEKKSEEDESDDKEDKKEVTESFIFDC